MGKGTKMALGIAAVGTAALTIWALTKKALPLTCEIDSDCPSGYNCVDGKCAKLPPPPNFAIKIVNLPSEANMWGCAFQDPATGEYYQPTNRPVIGSHLFDSSERAELDPPVLSGILSISAFYMVSAMDISQVANYQVPITIVKGETYSFDFSTGKII